MVHPFRDAIESRPQRPLDAGQPVALALVEEELAPTAVTLRQQLLVRLRGIRIHRRQIFAESPTIQLHPAHGLERLFHVREPVMDQPQHLVRLFEFLPDVAVMRHPPGQTVIEGERQRVLADDTHRRELDGHTAFAVVAVGQQQVFFRDVIAGDPDVAGQLGEDPDALPVAERAGGVVDGGVLADDGIEELERLVILQRGVFVADDAQHRVGALDEVARPPYNGKPVSHRDAFGAGEERQLDHLPIEAGDGDGFLGGGRLVEPGVETVPGNFVDVEHRSVAVLHEQIM